MNIFNNLKVYNSSSRVLKRKEPILEEKEHWWQSCLGCLCAIAGIVGLFALVYWVPSMVKSSDTIKDIFKDVVSAIGYIFVFGLLSIPFIIMWYATDRLRKSKIRRIIVVTVSSLIIIALLGVIMHTCFSSGPSYEPAIKMRPDKF